MDELKMDNVFKKIENDFTSEIFTMKDFLNVMSNHKIGFDDRHITRMYLEYVTKKPVYFDGGDLVDGITHQNIRCGSSCNQFNKDELVVITNNWYEKQLRDSQEILKFFKNLNKNQD